MSRFTVMVLLCLSLHIVFAEEPVVVAAQEDSPLIKDLKSAARNQTEINKLYEAAKIYVRKTMTEKEQQEWTQKWEQRLVDAARDFPNSDQETYTRDTMFNFCADNKDKFSNPEAAPRDKIVFLAMLYIRMIESQYQLPGKVIEKLTPENTSKVIKFLSDRENVDKK